MPKAVITTQTGATVAIEGTQAEVTALLGLFEQGERDRLIPPETRSIQLAPKSKPTPMGLLAELIGSGFFSTPRELGSVRQALEEQGHFYPVTTLSPLMLRLVRRKELRRLKDRKRWTYVG
ncbi:hypothetical protein [Bradyrhizobium sp. LMTR 3]|uniref:hypothetical protein n=1 Tax=Bradyrhizobium sp. LMTR 3 TaxID=189873 RepID=UPI000810470F|nr:hypothetical protein [Bradyrhizobium sp. LMTR 3]OCK58058.1 hypothetical protein LMTR3_03020 [Bradyrhizobium sp. LMTR 3]